MHRKICHEITWGSIGQAEYVELFERRVDGLQPVDRLVGGFPRPRGCVHLMTEAQILLLKDLGLLVIARAPCSTYD